MSNNGKRPYTVSQAVIDRNRKGGRALVDKYGSEHMSKIGKLGYQKSLANCFLAPVGTSGYLLVHTKSRIIIAVLFDKKYNHLKGSVYR